MKVRQLLIYLDTDANSPPNLEKPGRYRAAVVDTGSGATLTDFETFLEDWANGEVIAIHPTDREYAYGGLTA